MPVSPTDIAMQFETMECAGFSGCCASSDATHVPILNCRFGIRQSHIGWKTKSTARTYNISATRSRRILSSTGGHPSRWNDKSIIWFDDFLTSINAGRMLNNNKFILYEYGKNKEILSTQYEGCWVLVDNGYHDWPTTIAPFQMSSCVEDIRRSHWVS